MVIIVILLPVNMYLWSLTIFSKILFAYIFRQKDRCHVGSCSVWENNLCFWRSSFFTMPTLRWARLTFSASQRCSRSKALVCDRPTDTLLTTVWMHWLSVLGKGKDKVPNKMVGESISLHLMINSASKYLEIDIL